MSARSLMVAAALEQLQFLEGPDVALVSREDSLAVSIWSTHFGTDRPLAVLPAVERLGQVGGAGRDRWRALLPGQQPSSWCQPRAVMTERQPRWTGGQAVLLGELPLVCHVPASLEEPIPRKVLLPRKGATPLLHETLAWHGCFAWQQPPAGAAADRLPGGARLAQAHA